MNTKPISKNAKVAAVSFPLGAIMLHLLNQFDASLLPLRLVAVCILVFGVWAFSDEMGLRKPLNRAAFVSFIFATLGLVVILLEPETANSQYYLIYAFGTLFAILAWSAAYLHRPNQLKYVGAIGAFASLVPVLLLIAGHLSIGIGAFFGFGMLFEIPRGAAQLGTAQLNAIEAMLVIWSLIASTFLLRGNISASVVDSITTDQHPSSH